MYSKITRFMCVTQTDRDGQIDSQASGLKDRQLYRDRHTERERQTEADRQFRDRDI